MKHSQVSLALLLFDQQKVHIITGFSPVCKPPAEDFGYGLRWWDDSMFYSQLYLDYRLEVELTNNFPGMSLAVVMLA